jgi:hypothetical protein
MTNYSGRINNFVIGDHVTVQRDVTVPSGVTVALAWLTVKRRYNDLDANALIQKRITISDVAGSGYISNAGPGSTSGTGTVKFYLLPDDTDNLTPYSNYIYDIQIKYTDNVIFTPELGVITAFPQATITTS